MNQQELEDKLVEAGYPNLFMYGKDRTIEEIWKNGENKKKLKRLIKNASSSMHAKFLAAEVLKAYNIPLKEIWSILPEAYVNALENASNYEIYQLNANVWGFPYVENDLGYLGGQVIKFGQTAVPHLIKLLDNEEIPIYEGSSEATFGSAFGYRIKDFAAFYISKIKNIPIKFYQDIKERDSEVERFKKLINAN